MAKQESFEGMEQPTIPELTNLAHAYAKARDERMEKLKIEVDLKDKLLAKMHEHKLTVYQDRDEDLTITVKTEEKVKVKIKNEEEPEED